MDIVIYSSFSGTPPTISSPGIMSTVCFGGNTGYQANEISFNSRLLDVFNHEIILNIFEGIFLHLAK